MTELLNYNCENAREKTVELSVLIPTFNRARDLERCLRSVSDQKWNVSYEVLISENDAMNSENLKSVIDLFPDLPITYFVQSENIGMFGNWNYLISIANGKYFTLLNDDDVLLPEWSIILDVLSGSTMLGVKACEDSSWDGKDIERQVTNPVSRSISLNELYWGLWTNGTLGSVFHTESALSIGLFNSGLYPIADWDFYVRYIETFEGLLFDQVLALYGREESNSVRLPTMLKDTIISYQYRIQLAAKMKKNYSLRLFFIRNVYFAKKYSICKSLNPHLNFDKFPNVFLSFSLFRLALRIIPMRLIKMLLS